MTATNERSETEPSLATSILDLVDGVPQGETIGAVDLVLVSATAMSGSSCTGYLEKALTTDQRQLLEEHLADCPLHAPASRH